MNKLVIAVFTVSVLLLLTGCNASASTTTSKNNAPYRKLSAEQARKMLDQNPTAILLDVRTEAEFQERHIAGAKLIPNNELKRRAPQELPNQQSLILIYCRSGHRSQLAADLLIELGYTNVYDFGGIISYPYDTVRG